MKKILVILNIIVLFLGACKQATKKQTATLVIQDTVVVKHKDIPTFEDSNLKSYSYNWLAGKDTLDFLLNVNEWKRYNSLSINIRNLKPMLFADVLLKINKCLPIIKEDFDVSKLNSFYFKEPIYYEDLAKKLSSEYEHKFGHRYISYKELNQFLLQSSLTLQLDSFLNPLNKKVKSYGVEKFHLLEKKYYKDYLYNNARVSNIDFTEYPEFTINGMGLSVELESK